MSRTPDAGCLQVRFTGETGLVQRVFDSIVAQLPRGPRGGVIGRCSLKQNEDGVTSRAYVDLPPALYASWFGVTGVPVSPAAEMAKKYDYDDAVIVPARPAIDKRYQITLKPVGSTGDG